MELKNTMTELKIQEIYKGKINQAKERISKLKDKSFEIT